MTAPCAGYGEADHTGTAGSDAPASAQAGPGHVPLGTGWLFSMSADDVAETQPAHNTSSDGNTSSRKKPTAIFRGRCAEALVSATGPGVHLAGSRLKLSRLRARWFSCNGNDVARLYGNRALGVVHDLRTATYSGHHRIADTNYCLLGRPLKTAAVIDQHLSLYRLHRGSKGGRAQPCKRCHHDAGQVPYATHM